MCKCYSGLLVWWKCKENYGDEWKESESGSGEERGEERCESSGLWV